MQMVCELSLMQAEVCLQACWPRGQALCSQKPASCLDFSAQGTGQGRKGDLGGTGGGQAFNWPFEGDC